MKVLQFLLVLILLFSSIALAEDVAITLTIDDKTDLLLMANADVFGWTESIDQYDAQTGTKITVPNPKTKEEYIKDALINYALSQIQNKLNNRAYNNANQQVSEEIKLIRETMKITVKK